MSDENKHTQEREQQSGLSVGWWYDLRCLSTKTNREMRDKQARVDCCQVTRINNRGVEALVKSCIEMCAM